MLSAMARGFLIAGLLMVVACKSEKQKLAEQIRLNEQKLYNDTTKMMNPAIAEEELTAYTKYAASYPEDTASPAYLFKAADLAHALRKSREAIRLYREFMNQYPQHPKAASSLFLQAFVYDAEIQQKDSAKILYREFLQKYPTHQLAPSAKASLDQIEMGLSDEELIRMFEARLDSAQKKGTN